ncbi:hypothetical protein AB3G45_02520 [Shinella sp. S4-D37]|uniref:hypothetical protein n=1 Tax=Shinella sp. S4-D37 TaxID=3161999 RepID=UPI003465E745
MAIAIDQSPELQVRQSVNLILRHFEMLDTSRSSVPPDVQVPIVLYGPENLPDPLPF